MASTQVQPANGGSFMPGTHRPREGNTTSVSLAGAQLEHLTGYVGTVVHGFDLTRATDADVDAIRRLVAERGVLHFPGQEKMDNKSQAAFMRKFGEPYIHKSVKSADDLSEVMRIAVDKDSKFVFGAEALHADITYEQMPAHWTCLRVVEAPKNAGDTWFVDMRGVLDKFSPDMRALLKSKQAVHESYHVFKGEYGAAHRTEGGANAAAVEAPVFPESVHPVVLQHPETGVESLYVNRSFTTKIVDVPAIESKHLLDMAYYVTSNANEYQCRIKWSPNSLTLWDNYVVQHSASFDYPGQTRVAYRVTTMSKHAPTAPKASAAKL